MDEFLRQISQFWSLVVETWQQGFLGGDIGDALVALGIFLVFLFVRRLFARFVIANLRLLTRKTKTTIDDDMAEALAAPLRFIPVVLGVFFALEYLGPEDIWRDFADNLTRSLITATLFWALVRLVEPVSQLLLTFEGILTEAMILWAKRAFRWLFILVGAATVLQIWGVQVAPIIAGLGLFGVAVALGAQDMFKNLIAGLLILLERRFHNGDWINVDGIVEGTVESIGFRSTKVRRFDKAPVYVPNSSLSDTAVTNFSEMTYRRIYWKIGVEYRTTLEQLKQIRDGIEDYILSNDDFAHPPEVATFVRIDSFNDSSIDIMVYCFTRSTVWGEWLAIKEQLAYRIKEIVEGAGTGFAFPSQSLYIETLPGEAPEPFTPPTEPPTEPRGRPERDDGTIRIAEGSPGPSGSGEGEGGAKV